MTFRPTTESDAAAVVAFLLRIFDTAPGTSLDNPALVRWKYWVPRDDFPGPRSYVLETREKIVAHIGLWPMTFRNGVRGLQGIDWAAERSIPGAGLSLLKQVSDEFDFVYSIGGSSATQKLLPALGFREANKIWIAARPLRTVRQALTHQIRNWRLVPRLARNTLWSLLPALPETAGWTLAPCSPAQLPDRDPRGPGFFNYLQRCPIGQPCLYSVLQDGVPQGCLLLNIIRGQARIGGIWLNDPDPMRLRTAYTLAQSAARNANEIAAAGSTAESEAAVVQAGFRIRDRLPLFVSNKRNLPLPAEFQMTDDDTFFRDPGENCYLT